MILKEMLKLCKKNNTIRYIATEQEAYVSDGFVLANVTDIAEEWTAKDYATALELTPDDWDCYKIENSEIHEDLYKVKLIKADRMRFSLNIDGEPIQPFILEDGRALFVNCKYLSVFREEHPKEFYFGKFGNRYMLYIYVSGRIIGGVYPVRFDCGCVKDFARVLQTGAERSESEGFLQGYTQYSIFDEKGEENQ